MSSYVAPVKPPNIKLRDGTGKFHTLHCDKHVFTIQKNGTSIVAFRNKKDANQFGKLLEGHYEISRVWPAINFEDTILFKKPKDQILKYLSINSWREEDLRDFCIKNYINMLDIFRLENDYRLVGRSVSWEAPMDFYIDRLNKKLDDS
jgi:hypothetical protein